MERQIFGSGQVSWPPATTLARLTEAERDDLLARGRPRLYAAGQTLIRQGESTTQVIVLLDGYVKITGAGDEGRVTFLAIRVGGDLVGELAALDGDPRLATVTAGGAVLGRVITRDDFRRFLTANPGAGETIISSISAKLRGATHKLVDFNGRPVRVRVARVLVELARAYGKATPQGVELSVSLTQPELAGLVSASEPAVHKALTELRRDDVIATGYRGWVVKDADALRSLGGLGTCPDA
ncbi:Crp/Fnr family transcriptional regulator [Allonocardiopsis opalescens]|uniref:CRP-like cAMP-binding protein n=1 Tax=Allonocardiopsis opalescens TaxID=1144618 RepID=A0A2T0QA35_9ACTN|nr:Crp/Fnr family transcriptional regulator [Allonocardiopsis opalescens]PRY00707.1 CRP-like cAMP-binding protein [Allonocardiopsis opalescens]